jgi:hypothetical protein
MRLRVALASLSSLVLAALPCTAVQAGSPPPGVLAQSAHGGTLGKAGPRCGETTDLVDLARGSRVEANSSALGHGATKAIDGDMSTTWTYFKWNPVTWWNGKNLTYTVDLGAVHDLRCIVINWGDDSEAPWSYGFSRDGSQWNYRGGSEFGHSEDTSVRHGEEARYVRVTSVVWMSLLDFHLSNFSIKELEIYGR